MDRFRIAATKITASLVWLEPYYRVLAVSTVLTLSAAITYSSWDFAQRAAESELHARFEFRASQIRDAIRGRVVNYEQVLRSGGVLFAATQSVGRDDWRAYVQNMRIEEIYPAIQGIGFAPRVAAAQKELHERTMRASGYHNYAIWPQGAREEYAPITYIEPLAGANLRALGFDLRTEPLRRAAMEQARDSGVPAISGKVQLSQDDGQHAQAGVTMWLPVYRDVLEASTVAQRRGAIIGYIFGAIRVTDLMQGILGSSPDVGLQVFDGEPTRDGTLLYDSAPNASAGLRMFSITTRLPIRGRTWTLRTVSLPSLEATLDRNTPNLVAFTSAAVSLLVLAIIWSLATMHERAARLARSMTSELRASRERLSLAMEASSLAMFDWDVATGKVILSDEWLGITGGGPATLDTTIEELEALIHPNDRQQVRRATIDLVKGEIPFYRYEHRVRTVSSGWRWISSRAKVVAHDAGGRASRVTGTNVDITDRKEIERLKNEFVATVSHELRTPLTAIVGALGLLKGQAVGKLPPDAAMFVDIAQQNGERLAALVNDILDSEKIEAGSMEFNLHAVNVRPLLERAIKLNAPYAAKFNVRYELREPVPDAIVSGDDGRLLQVITNLMSNAAKFSPGGAAVAVFAEIRGRELRIAVTNHGPGVPDELRGRIFERFAQGDGSDTRLKGGTGLGLFICKAIVEKMGGTIGYTSGLGHGATFYFDLPLQA